MSTLYCTVTVVQSFGDSGTTGQLSRSASTSVGGRNSVATSEQLCRHLASSEEECRRSCAVSDSGATFDQNSSRATSAQMWAYDSAASQRPNKTAGASPRMRYEATPEQRRQLFHGNSSSAGGRNSVATSERLWRHLASSEEECRRSCAVDPRLMSSFVWLGYANSALNPVIYTIFNADFRRAFRRLLHQPCSTVAHSSWSDDDVYRGFVHAPFGGNFHNPRTPACSPMPAVSPNLRCLDKTLYSIQQQ